MEAILEDEVAAEGEKNETTASDETDNATSENTQEEDNAGKIDIDTLGLDDSDENEGNKEKEAVKDDSL